MLERLKEINLFLRENNYCDVGYYDGLLAERAMILKMTELSTAW